MNVNAKPIIGILGGMGPDATVELMRRVIGATPARDDCDHVHLLVDSNPNVPSRIAALIDRTGPSPAPELVRMARRLEAAGAGALALACNTAHGYADDIRAAVGIPLIDVIALTAEAVAAMTLPRRRVGLLASTAVDRLGLFERATAAQGIALVTPAEQSRLMGVIKAVKRGDRGRNCRYRFASVARDLMNDQVDVLLIACSELSVLTDSLDEAAPCIDTLDLLAREIVAYGMHVGERREFQAASMSSR